MVYQNLQEEELQVKYFMTKIDKQKAIRIRQGDIFRDVEFIEYAEEHEGIVDVSKISFPLIVVLTQDCDLEGDYTNRDEKEKERNKFIFSVIVAPIYNFDHFLLGQHLTEIKINMQRFSKNKTPYKYVITNQNPRYHYLEFPEYLNIIRSGVIDFKHYFTVTVKYLEEIKEINFVCKISELYREDISQRFAAYLSRIGLPSMA